MPRRLTDQQQRRVASQRARHARSPSTDVAGTGPEETSLGPEENALVIARYGNQVDVERSDGSPLRCHLRARMDALVAGDRVVVRTPPAASATGGVVVACCERHTVLARPDSRGLLRPVAANIDTLLVTIAPQPQAYPFLIDRYLVAASLHGIAATVICNKTDLITAGEHAAMTQLLAIYRRIGYPVFEVSAQAGSGMPALARFLADKTAVVVGQSGVGKSSLINALLPGIDIATGSLSAGVDKGRHTTTTARLYHLPGGGQLIDSPGIREFTLQHLPAGELLQHFVDLREHAAQCRFRDCRHENEPGCALLAAEQAGTLSPQRLASYRHILASLS